MSLENWHKLKTDEKFEAVWAGFGSTEGKTFGTPEIARTYQRRVQRLKDVCQLKTPDRVPALLSAGGVVADYAGASHGEMLYDYNIATEAVIKFNLDFKPDYQAGGNFLPGRVFDTLGCKTYRWPGDGLPMNMAFQMVEGEYMQADEYDQLIAEPETFYMRTYMPRVFTALEGWKMLPTFWASNEMPMTPAMLIPIAMPPVRKAFQALLDASQATMDWLGASAHAGGQITAQTGAPSTLASFTKAPFDFIGDTLRGTRGIMLDMYRQPDKLLAAMERLVPIAIQMGAQSAIAAQNPLVFIPLHKGADGFMSDGDFKKFYWPTLEAVLRGLINEGVVPLLFVEGAYNQRLDVIAESGLPAGKTMWMFDQTDMAVVKEKFGSWGCIGGNVPASLFHVGTPQQVEDYAKNLIDTAGKDGGYFLTPGAVIDQAKPENLHAFINVAREYGVY